MAFRRKVDVLFRQPLLKAVCQLFEKSCASKPIPRNSQKQNQEKNSDSFSLVSLRHTQKNLGAHESAFWTDDE